MIDTEEKESIIRKDSKMKKKIMGLIAIVAIATIAGYNVCASQNNMKLSDLTLSNMDALAFPEIGDRFLS